MKKIISSAILSIQAVATIFFVIIVLLGGFKIHLLNKSIPFHSVDVFGILIFLSFILNHYILDLPKNFIELTILKLVEKIQKLSSPKLGILILIAIFTFWFLHSLRHLSFLTHFYDVAFVQQPLFYAFENPLLRCDACIKNSYLAEHNAFTFFLLAPLTNLVKSNYLIFIIECLTIFAPLYFMIKNGPLKDKKYLFLFSLLIILCSRALRQSLTWDFREDHLSFLFLSLTLLFWYQKRLIPFFLCGVLAMGCKENVAFITFGMGLSCMLDSYLQRKKQFIKYGLLLSVLSTLYIIFLFKFFIPFMLGDQQKNQVLLMRFSQYGSTPNEIIKNILITPAYWWDLVSNHLLTFDRIKYVFILCSPFIIIGYNSFQWIIPISLGLAMNIFHEQATQRMMMFHYDLIILPFLFFIMLDGLNRSSLSAKKIIIGASLAFSLSGKWPSFYLKEYWPTMSEFKNARWLSTIITNKPIASNLNIVPHIIHNKNLRAFGEFQYQTLGDLHKLTTRSQHNLEDAEYFLINTLNKTDSEIFKILQAQKINIIEKSPDKNILLIKRVI